jgi:hypothetical protein
MLLKIKPTEINKKVDAFIEASKRGECTPTMEGLALFLGIAKVTLYEYLKKPVYANALKKAELYIETYLQNKLLVDNKPVGAIFMLKAKFGYIEQQKVDLTSNGQTMGVVQIPSIPA